MRALRHPDVSVIVDLSKVAHREKREYLRTLLPLLVTLRRNTGLPHKILLDEAHYFLGGPDISRLVDPELAGYIFVTYRISSLPAAIRATADAVVLVTRETDPEEAKTLLTMCRPQPCAGVSPDVFRDLQTTEAALLPGAEEAHGQVRRFQLAPRLTAHVRHRTKYLDMPVLDSQAFVFTGDGRPGARARTLKEFTGLLTALPADRLAGHLRRHDFSRWIEEVFRDRPLAAHLRKVEAGVETDDPRDVADAVAQAIRARYETAVERLRTEVRPGSAGLAAVLRRVLDRVFGRASRGDAGMHHRVFGRSSRPVIRITGSDTMVNLVQAWAENYKDVRPTVSVQVAGGGSGVGIAGLIDGTLDIAAASREMKGDERQRASPRNGVEPKEFTVALDALAVYVHKDNPLDVLSIEELAEIYGEHGMDREMVSARCQESRLCQRPDHPRGPAEQLRHVRLLPRRRAGRNARIQDGLHRPERVQGCGRAHLEDTLRHWVQRYRVRDGGCQGPEAVDRKGQPSVAPSPVTVIDRSYPIARPLYLYTAREPTGQVKAFLDWVLAQEGQQIVRDLGFVPVPTPDS